MQLAVCSDIHSNWVALQAVFEDAPNVDGWLCAGDIVGYNPWPRECVGAIREREFPTVMGNHDRAAVGETTFGFNPMARAGIEHARRELGETHLEWLASLPDERRAVDERIRIVHGHPDDPDHYTMPSEFEPALLADEDVLIMGHTHIQHHEIYDEGVVLNPGSVGQPRDGDPRAAYTLLDLETLTVEERRVKYDIRKVQTTIREVGLPERLATRLSSGR